ncbi:MAG: TRAM domain-containing protein, partial [Alphaproteobacteria bacterium]
YAQAYSFKYSARPGTPAAGLDIQVDEAVKDERLAVLQELLEAQQETFNAATVGRRIDVLLDRPGRHAGQLLGRSPYNQAVHVAAPAVMRGAIVPVDIVGAASRSLSGRAAGTATGDGTAVCMQEARA